MLNMAMHYIAILLSMLIQSSLTSIGSLLQEPRTRGGNDAQDNVIARNQDIDYTKEYVSSVPDVNKL